MKTMRIESIPSDDEILEYVTAIAGDGGFQASMYQVEHRLDLWRRVRYILSLILPLTPRVLETGCAEGLVSSWIAPQVERLVGLDFLPVGIRACEARELPNAEFHLMNLRDLTPDFGEFDLVLCCDVLEHLPDPRAFMATIKQLGRGILATTDINEFPNPLAFNLAAHANPQTNGDGSSHIWSFREDTFKALFDEVWHYEDNGVTAIIWGR